MTTSTLKAGADPSEVSRHFAKAADHYDLMNDIMSGGLHHGWKRAMVSWLEVPNLDNLNKGKPYRLLDLAAGSGDLTQIFLDAHPQAQAVLADPSRAMMQKAKTKLAPWCNGTKSGGAKGQVHFAEADGQTLPFASRSFDACLLGFGIRNIKQREQALEEIYRTLKLGGRFLCLEFTPHPAPFLEPLYHLYLNRIIPQMGQRVAGEKKAYAYLARSIKAFPAPPQFAAAMRLSGFARVQYRLFSGGVVALFSGWRF